jgi:predicted ABC-type transport system involved in lysophospholipase L1 biosynthesis ATPase subunit
VCFADHCSGQSAEAVILISSLRDVIRQQSGEIEALQKRLKEASMSTGSQVRYYCVQFTLQPFWLIIILAAC